MLTEQDIRDRLHAAIEQAGSQAAFARQHSISLQYVNDVVNGRRDLGQKILDALQIERIVTYRERPVVTPMVTPMVTPGVEQPPFGTGDPRGDAE